MLETSEERIKLLKAGFAGKAIELLYIKCNNFRIIDIPAVIELVELDIQAETKLCNTISLTAEHGIEKRVQAQGACER